MDKKSPPAKKSGNPFGKKPPGKGDPKDAKKGFVPFGKKK